MAALTIQRRENLRILALDTAACGVAGVVLGMLGPFGSYLNGSVLVRMAYWTGTFVLFGIALSALMRAVAPRARAHGVRMWVWLPILALTANVAFAGLSRLIATTIWPEIGKFVGPVEWFGQSLLITMIGCGAYAYFRLRPQAAEPTAAPPETDSIFLKRLPTKVGRDIVCLQMEDHYVRVHTTEGSVLVLTPLKQAIAELIGVDGMQVHRSWWVVRRAVVGVVTDSRNLRLKLTNGLLAPVARAQIARLRANGWID